MLIDSEHWGWPWIVKHSAWVLTPLASSAAR